MRSSRSYRTTRCRYPSPSPSPSTIAATTPRQNFPAASAALIDKVRRAGVLEGQIEIASGDAPPTRIVDELDPWIQNPCFNAVSKIAAGDSVTIRYFSRAG